MNHIPSDDIPFVLHGGDSIEAALHNRVTAINRINFIVRKKISDFDIRLKTDEYRRVLDLNMWKKYYQDQDTKQKINEEFCQRTAQECIEMEGYEEPKINEEEFNKAIEKADVPEKKNNLLFDFFRKWNVK